MAWSPCDRARQDESRRTSDWCMIDLMRNHFFFLTGVAVVLLVSCARREAEPGRDVRNTVLPSESVSPLSMPSDGSPVPIPPGAWDAVRTEEEGVGEGTPADAVSSVFSSVAVMQSSSSSRGPCGDGDYSCTQTSCATSDPDCTFEDLALSPMGIACAGRGGVLFKEGSVEGGGELSLWCDR